LYTKLDGVHPEQGAASAGNASGKSRVSIMDGSYKFAMEMKSFVPAVPVDAYGETLLGEMLTQMKAPTDCTTVGRGLAVTANGGGSCAIGVAKAKGTKLGNNCKNLELNN
jgi:hypothetical protein